MKAYMIILLTLLAAISPGALQCTVSAVNGHGQGFMQDSGLPVRQKTEFSLRCDEKNLYINAVCHFPENEQLRIQGSHPDDMKIFRGECVEIFISPVPEKRKYYQFVINPNAITYTALGHDKTWEPSGWTKRIRMEKDRWTLELILPYQIFGISKPKRDEVWGLHFARSYVPAKGTPEHGKWCDISDYHDCTKYNRLVFYPLEALPRIELREFQESDRGVIHAEFDFENITDPVSLCISDGSGKYQKEVQPRTRKVHADSIFRKEYIPLKENIEYAITARNGHTGKLIFSRNIHFRHNFSGMLLPDKLYYVPSDGTVNFTVDPCGISSLQKHPSFIVTLSGNGETVRKTECCGKGMFSLAGLKPGRYLVEASNGQFKTSRVIYLLQKHEAVSGLPRKSGLKIEGKIFTANHKPLFLIGGSVTGKPLPKDICFNLNSGNFGAAANPVELIQLPGKSYTRKFSCYLYPFSGKDEFFKYISKEMNRFDRDSPKIFRMTYEAQLRTCFQLKNGSLKEMDSIQWHKEFYSYLKKEYPDFYFSLQTDHEPSIPGLAPSCDIFEVTPKGGYMETMMPSLLKTLPEATRTAGRKPVICWLGATIPNNKCRTAEELRGGVFYNIIHDSAGVIFHLGHGILPQSRTRLWSFIKHIHTEIQEFYPAFRSMPRLNEKEFSKFLVIRGEKYTYSLRGSEKEAIAVIMNLSPAENTLTIQTGNHFAVTDRSGMRLPENYEWKATPYEAIVLRIRKQ